MNSAAIRSNRRKLLILAAIVLLCAAGYMLVGVNFSNPKLFAYAMKIRTPKLIVMLITAFSIGGGRPGVPCPPHKTRITPRPPGWNSLLPPTTPAGGVYSAGTGPRLPDILARKSAAYGHTIFLVSDEPYRDIVFDGGTVPYPAAFYPHTLTCFSFSKSLSLPGERLGYVAVAPGCEGEEVLVDMMAQVSRFTGHNCPPSIIQKAAARCLDVTSDLAVYEENMDLLYDALRGLGFEVERPGGTFYIFPKALEPDANAFCRKAREFDLLLVPSDTFGVEGYVRLAYCIETEKVRRSLPALERLAAAYK